MPTLVHGGIGLLRFDEQFPIYNWMHPLRGEERGTSPLADVFPAVDSSITRERSLYFHVPFCDTICTFCTLNRGLGSEGDEQLETYTQALIREIQLKSEYDWVQSVPPSSIFFGGGTPSVLSADQLDRICGAINDHFDMSRMIEWTFEMEVKSVTEEKCAVLAAHGVNRSRFGVQSFTPRYRSLFNITATLDQTHEAIETAGRHFEGRGIDLIFGMHGQTFEELSYDLGCAASAGTETVDCYPITNLATQSGLHAGYARRGLGPTSYLDKMAMTLYVNEFLSAAGFKRHNSHGFVRLGDKPQSPSGYTREYRNYYNTQAIFALHDSDVVGLGSSAISQVGRHVLQNDPNRASYVAGLQGNELELHVTHNDRVPWDRGLVFFLPYQGEVAKSLLPWEHIRTETRRKLDELIQEGLVVESETSYAMTDLGWIWYVNAMYHLSLDEDQEQLDKLVTVRSRPSALTDGDRRTIPAVVAA